MASDVVESIDAEETSGLVQDLVRIKSRYFEKAKTGAFVHDWLGERDLSPEYHHPSEPGITGVEGENVIAGVRFNVRFTQRRVLRSFDPKEGKRMSGQAKTTMIWVLIGAGIFLGLTLMLIGGPPAL